MKNKSLIIFLLILLSAGSSRNTFAQNSAQSLGFNLILGFPTGEFQNNVKRIGVGVGGECLYFFNENNPLGVGLDLEYIDYGMESRTAPFSSTIPDANVNVDRTNNLVNFHVLFRLIAKDNIVRPYFDLLFGGEYLFTKTTVSSDNTSEEITTTQNINDWAWSYGFGGGILYKFFDQNGTQVLLDLKCRYLRSSEANYLSEGDVHVTRSGVIYNIRRSKTDLINAQVGVQIYFDVNKGR
jgi:hypothetical protein